MTKTNYFSKFKLIFSINDLFRVSFSKFDFLIIEFTGKKTVRKYVIALI